MQKKIKVQYSSRSTQQMPNRALPKIQMEGKWLADLGFQVGDHLEVICEQGQILIRSLAIQEELLTAEHKEGYKANAIEIA